MDYRNIISMIGMIFFLSLLSLRERINPEKSIKKNLQNTAAQSSLLGNWDISFTTSGISYTVSQKGKVFMSWNEFSQIAETEHAFYLMRKEKRQFIPLPKECLSGYEQTQDVLQYCRTKGLTPIQVAQMKYLPVWLFRVLLVLSMCLLLVSGMWHG